MFRKMLRSFSIVLALLASLAVLERTASAGPPLICHSIEIGNAASLPWGKATDWRAVKQNYELNRVVDDTLALLTPQTPVLVRMETLRRATIYAVWAMRDREIGYTVKDEKVADQLLSRLMDRLRESVRTNQPPSLALFDAGYLTACYEQAGYQSGQKSANGYPMVRKAADGYAMVRKASGAQSSAEMEFAAALTSVSPAQPSHREHLQRAIAGAKDGSLLARNIVSHFGKPGQSLSDLRAQLARS
jgi:hypothetical protein